LTFSSARQAALERFATPAAEPPINPGDHFAVRPGLRLEKKLSHSNSFQQFSLYSEDADERLFAESRISLR
jgi:hypothetical protein